MHDVQQLAREAIRDNGRGASQTDAGTGLERFAQRVYALGGTFEAGPSEASGFRLRVRLGAGGHT